VTEQKSGEMKPELLGMSFNRPESSKNKTRRKLLQRADQGKSIEEQAAHDSTGTRDEVT
jgi:hypothetical protein